MPRRKLQNYLRTHRKRFGLSQKEVAYLLGCASAADVCRYECCAHLPSLSTALACQALFGIPVAELFAGLYEQVEKETARRARVLARRLAKVKPDKAAERRASFLRAVAVTPDITKENS